MNPPRELDPRFFPNAPPRGIDPFTGEKLDESTVPIGVPSQMGGLLDLTSVFPPVPVTIAQLDTKGTPIAAVVTCDATRAGPLGWGNALVNWTVTWGIGGANFKRSFAASYARFCLEASWIRVDAINVQFQAIRGSRVVNASVQPSSGGDESTLLTAINVNYGTGADQPSGAYLTSTSGLTKTGADNYLLQGSSTVAAQGKVKSVSGFCSATTGNQQDYLFLFDTNTAPPTGIAPMRALGPIIPNSLFTFDLGRRGQDYGLGLVIAASSTPSAYTRDAGAVLAVDHEIILI